MVFRNLFGSDVEARFPGTKLHTTRGSFDENGKLLDFPLTLALMPETGHLFLTKSKKINEGVDNLNSYAVFLKKFGVENLENFYSTIIPKLFYEKRDNIIDLSDPAIQNQTKILDELKQKLESDLNPSIKEKLTELIKVLEESLSNLEDDAKFYEIHYEGRKKELRIIEHKKFLQDPDIIFEEEYFPAEEEESRGTRAELEQNELFKIFGLTFGEVEYIFRFYNAANRKQNAEKIFISVPGISDDQKTLKFSSLFGQRKFDFWQTRNDNQLLTEYSSKTQILGYSSGNSTEEGHNCYQQITRYRKYFDEKFNKVENKGYDIMLELPGANPLSIHLGGVQNDPSFFLWIDLDIEIKDGEDYKATTGYRTRFLNDDEVAEPNFVNRVKKYLDNLLQEYDRGVKKVWTNSRNEKLEECFFFLNGYNVYEEYSRLAEPYVRALSEKVEPNKELIEKNMDKIIAEIRNHYENLDAILEKTKEILK